MESQQYEDLKVRSTSGLFWVTAARWTSQGIALPIFLVLARLLTPEDFGLLAMALVYLAFIEIFTEQGFVSAIIQHQELEEIHLDTAFWASLFLGLVLTIISIGFSGLSATIFNEPRLSAIIRVLSFRLLLTSLFTVQTALARRSFQFRKLAIRSVWAKIAGGTVAVSMAFAGFGVWSLVGQSLAGAIVSVLVMWRLVDWHPSFRFSWTRCREFLRFGINIFGMRCVNFLNLRTGHFLIGFFLGTATLGYYAFAFRIYFSIMQLLGGVAQNISLSTFSRLQNEVSRLRVVFLKSTSLALFISIPAIAAAAILAPDWIPIYLGQKWTPAVLLFQLFALLAIVRTYFMFNNSIMIALGKASWSFRITILNVSINLIFLLWAIQWGVLGVVVASVIRAYLLSPISVMALRHLLKFHLKDYFWGMVAPLCGSAGLLMVVLVLRTIIFGKMFPFLELTILSTAGLVTYLLIVRLIDSQLLKHTTSLLRLTLSNFRKAEKG